MSVFHRVFGLRIILLAAVAQTSWQATTAAESPLESNPRRNVYFGDLHLHTSYSWDSYLAGTRTSPDEAYKYARGEPVSYMGCRIQRGAPLDFLAVTDHAENLGVLNQLDDPASALSHSPLADKIRNKNDHTIWELAVEVEGSAPQGGKWIDRKVAASAWQREMAAANDNYQPGKFTTFIGFEWTSTPDGKSNLHRNVIFRGNTAPFPFSQLDSQKPEDLWAYLEANRKRGFESVAIPHNANMSNGLMYEWNDDGGRPIDRNYALRRAFNEPLMEMSQLKGQSETHPVLSPTDEFAGFEIFDYVFTPGLKERSQVHGSYAREAYGRGLILQKKIGVNPYKFGAVGGSDLHSGLQNSAENMDSERRVFAQTNIACDETAANKAIANITFGSPLLGSPGLTGVWAERNSRESLYAALRRKETFATSGSRLKVRFFGGWNYARNALTAADWLQSAYAKGVPMGGDLPPPSPQARAPEFLVWAVKDPNSGNLDRIQVVKVWLQGEQYQERVYDVAYSGERKPDPKTGKIGAVGDTVDLKTATYKNSIGAAQLQALWTDPEFDPHTAAVYYLRVLEIPTPRWTTLQAVKAGLPLPKGAPATIQERGWSSPIWYSPPLEQSAARGG